MARPGRILAFAGPSGSGKTTLIAAMIRELVRGGRSVSAIKHTHHELNEARDGDSGCFLRAGALPVILAGDGDAVLFAPQAQRITYRSPLDLLDHCSSDIVLIEGFKDFDGWPRADAASIRDVGDALALLDRIG